MCDKKTTQIKEIAMKIYGDQIDYFARGSEELEKSALNECIPPIVALTLPEHYASIVLTSRMDNELQKLLERTLHRQGDAEKLLFEFNSPFGTFSSKIDAAYSFGFLTKNMHNALTYCRKIRNSYAHTDNPDEARESKDYKKYKPKLLNLDSEYLTVCVAKLNTLRDKSEGLINDFPDFSEVVAVMVEICEMLNMVAFYALSAKVQALRFPCAFLGVKDAPAYDSESIV